MDDSAEVELAQQRATFPQLAEKELALMVQARNSLVAAWLWHRHAVSVGMAGKAIRIDGLCDIVSVGGN
jgi:hypothetical protein